MTNEKSNEMKDLPQREHHSKLETPLPSASYRRRAWLEFQRALDPLAPPKPLRPPRS